MPDRPLTVASYALGASLCAISLLYVFGPSFAFEADAGGSSKRRIVGLENPANICFLNSVLQSLANSPELRLYLIREIHRRRLDGKEVYATTSDEVKGQGRRAVLAQMKLDNLQNGIVTHALKTILDKLNERPLQRKTISAQRFIEALETAFGTNISRAQQDAQEFLQLVLERLDDEHQAGVKARRNHHIRKLAGLDIANGDAESLAPKKTSTDEDDSPGEFSFEGKVESQIECKTCGFKPKPSISTFVNLTLHVPQQTHSTTLNDCFDLYLKDERIEGFKCDKCRLEHAKRFNLQQLTKEIDRVAREKLQLDLQLIEAALKEDPERDLAGHLPDLKHAPAGTIVRHVRISKFPRVLAIHLSRSMYSNYSTKNYAKVAFPETLALGGLLDPHLYKLSSLVVHKGGHNSGHYETFRRQVPAVPYSTPFSLGTQGLYSRQNSPTPSSADSSLREGSVTPQPVTPEPPQSRESSPIPPSRSSSQRSSSKSSRSSLSRSLSFRLPRPPTSAPRPTTADEKSSTAAAPESPEVARLEKKRRKMASKWWRISDDKVRESKTSDVLSMQKEVYLLFYEIDTRLA
jgi:ubiquitin carboxyl-terminal hydrolase 16